MDAHRFDTLTRTVTAPLSRRVTLGGLVAGVLVALGLTLEAPTVRSKKKGKRKDCPKSKPKRCGDKCCKPSERCKKGKCVNHCNDGKTNFGETSEDCGGTCRDVRKCRVGGFCAEDADCESNVCIDSLAFPGQKLCRECRGDNDCTQFGDPQKFRCFSNECHNCSRDADCPRSGQRAEQDKCVEPLAGGCPSGQPCVCRECLRSEDCPQGERCDENNNCTAGCLAEGATCTIFQDGSDECCDTPEELSCIGGQCVS